MKGPLANFADRKRAGRWLLIGAKKTQPLAIMVITVVLLVAVVVVVAIVLIVLLLIVAVILLILVAAVILLVILLAIHCFALLSCCYGDSFVRSRQTIHGKKEDGFMLIRNGLVFTLESERPAEMDVQIRNGKITKAAPVIEPEQDETVFDARGMRVYPGFIDAHSHIGIAQEKETLQGDITNEGTNPITPCMRAIDAINPMDSAFHNAIASGITGVMVGPGSANPIGGQFAFIKTDGRCIDDMIVKAPAAIKIAFGENPMNNYGMNGNMPSTRMAIASLIREELFRAQQYFANEKDDSQKDYTLECYRELFDGRIPLKAHVHRADDIFTAIRIAKEFGLGLTLDHCTEGHLIPEEIAASGFPAIVGPSLASRSKNEVNNSDFKTAGILHHAGVTVALTTDHPVSRIQYLPLCAALAAKEGLGEEAALRAITVNAAKICGLEQRLGSLSVGKDADFALWDGSPLLVASRVRHTVINGKVVYAGQ